MQGTTRSVEAVEGVVVEAAKAMASGGTVSLSASAGGVKSSVVLNHGGRGRYNKRKGLPGGGGGHSSTITIGKKKLCSSSSTNEIAQPAATAADTAVAVTILKKKERSMDEEIVGDLSLEDAARALADFSWFAHKPVIRSSPHGSHKSLLPALPQWKTTKVRSGRTRRMESSSNEDFSHHAITTTDSSNPSPLLLEKQQQQVSECSSSPGGDSQSVITLVKVEDGPFCSSTGVEEEEQVEQHKVVEVVVEEEGQDENNNNDNRCFPSDSERLVLHKFTSVSSIESLLPDSRAESPSSPLPPVLRTGEFASLCGVVPKFEGSAFRRVVPIRPVKKPTSCRKLKVEEKTFEDLNPEQAAVKHVSRKKPRPTGFVPQQQQQVHHQQQQQLAPVKVEETDAFCALALGPPRLSAAEEEEVKVGVLSRISPPSAAAVAVEEKPVKFDPVIIKLETKPSGKLGRTTSKAKPALSESEKEARKQRRVQANRESARLTIRKKQVLCEELSRKAQFLSTENEQFRKEVERMLQEKKNISEVNSKLKEEVAKAAGKHEPGSSSLAPPCMGKPPDGMVQYQFPHQFGGLPMVPPYMWAFAMAQAQAAAQVAAIQPSEIDIGSAEFTAFFAAAAAAAACGSNSQAGFWNMASNSSSQGQSSMMPPFLPGHLPGASVASALPSSCDTPATMSPITRSISLPVGPTDASYSLVASERSLPSGKPVASFRSGDFADSVHLSHDLKRNATQQDSTYQGSGFSGRTHYFQMTPGSQTGMATTGVGNIATRKSGDGNGLPMSNGAGQPLSRSHSLSTPHMSKLHSRYSMFGSGGISVTQERPTARESEAQRVHAAAAEARRKRIELKRTKSILNRQVARVAEPSA